MAMRTATYSPQDDKLRLYAEERLDQETYDRVKEAGFRWAPKQRLFFAVWSPHREDLLQELCGEIDAEETTAQERAVERAERFEGYSDRRRADAESAAAAVKQIADGIPFGQPILVGHHSERKARKDKERIDSGMSKAVKNWRTSEYWAARAEDVIHHADYREKPGVRERRVKTLAAERRKHEKVTAEADKFTAAWREPGLDLQKAMQIANYDYVWLTIDGDKASLWSHLDRGKITPEDAARRAIEAHERGGARRARWIEHLSRRISYEQALLNAETGGATVDKSAIMVGGQVLVGGSWLVVTKVTRKDGELVSVTTNASRGRVKSAEVIADYRAPDPEEAKRIKEAVKAPPIVNHPGEGFREITKAQWAKIDRNYKGTRAVAGGETHGAHRVRISHMGVGRYGPVYITDQKRVDPPAPNGGAKATIPAPKPDAEAAASRSAYTPPERTKFDDMAETLKGGGAQVAVAPQLFSTPERLAARMAQLADLSAGCAVLEPSAGTGRLIAAAREECEDVEVMAVEINGSLCERLRRQGGANIHRADFMEWEPGAQFDRVLMNPPFEKGGDVKHIQRAFGMLKPGGRLVAICANGPRQALTLRLLAEKSGGLWEELPEGAFADEGTSVKTALIVINA